MPAGSRVTGVYIEFEPTLSNNFRTDLKKKLAEATKGIEAMVAIKVEGDQGELRRNIKEAINSAKKGITADVNISIDANLRKLRAQVQETAKRATAGIDARFDLGVDADTRRLRRTVETIATSSAAGVRADFDVGVDANTTALHNKVRGVALEAQRGVNAKVGVEIQNGEAARLRYTVKKIADAAGTANRVKVGIELNNRSVAQMRTKVRAVADEAGAANKVKVGMELNNASVAKTVAASRVAGRTAGVASGSAMIVALGEAFSIEKIAPLLMVTFLGAIASVAPFVLAAFGGLITAAFGLTGILGGTILATLASPMLRDKMKRLGLYMYNQLRGASKPFVAEVSRALDYVKTNFQHNMKYIRQILQSTAPMVGILVRGVGDFLSAILPGIAALTAKSREFVQIFMSGLVRIGAEFGRAFKKWASNNEVMAGFRQGLKDLMGLLSKLIGMLLNAIGRSAIFWGRHHEAVKKILKIMGPPAVAIFGTFFAAMAGVKVIAGVNAMIQAYILLGKAINLAMAANLRFIASLVVNPIFWIVLAIAAVIGALVALYFKWKWFHNSVNKAARVAWHGILVAVKATGRGFKWVWDKVLFPPLKLMGKVLLWLWKNVCKPLFGLMRKGWEFVGRTFKMVWDKFLWPALKFFGKVMKMLWDKFLKPVFSLIGRALKPLVSWLTRTKIVFGLLVIILAPVAAWIITIIALAVAVTATFVIVAGVIWALFKAGQAIVNFFKGPFMTGMHAVRDFFQGPFLAPFHAIRDFFTGPFLTPFHAIRDFFQSIGDKVVEIWNNIVNFVKDKWNKIKEGWDFFINLIKTKWKNFTHNIKFLWEWVWNHIKATFEWFKNLILQDIQILKSVGLAIWHGLVTAWNAVWNGLKIAWNAVWNGIKAAGIAIWTGIRIAGLAIWNGIRAAWNAVWNGARMAFMAIWNGIRAAGIAIWNGLSIAGRAIWNAMRTAWSAVWNGARAVFIAIWNGIRAAGTAIWNGMRAAAMAIWNGIRIAGTAIWNGMRNVAISIWNGMRTAGTNIWNTMRNVAMSIWNGMRTVGTAIWNTMRNVAISIWNAMRTVGTNIWNTMRNVAISIWNGLRNAGTAIWNTMRNVALAIWNTLKNGVQNICRAIGNFVVSVWNNIKNGVINLCNTIKNKAISIWNAFKGGVQNIVHAIGNFIVARWNDIKNGVINFCNTIKDKALGIWNAFKDKIMGIAHGIRDGVASAFHAMIDKIKDALNQARDWINKGIHAVNVVITKVGIPKIPDVPALATGGYVKGPGGPTDDKVYARLSNGEYVLNAKAVKKIGLRKLNKANRDGELEPAGLGGDGSGGIQMLPRLRSAALDAATAGMPFAPFDMATGGAIAAQIRRAQLFIRQAAGKPYVWASAGPGGYDCSGIISAVYNMLLGRPVFNHTFSTSDEGNYFKPGHGTFTAGWANPGERGGGSVGHTAGNLAGLAFEATPPRVKVGGSATSVDSFAHVGYLPQAGDHFIPGGGGGDILGFIMDEIKKPLENIWKKMPFGDKLPNNILVEKFKAVAENFMNYIMKFIGAIGSGLGKALDPIIRLAMKMTGVPASWFGPLKTLIERESGGDPNAINMTDSNAAAGHPSKGLMQVIKSTFDSFRSKILPNNPLNPLANIVAGINYIKSRYGTIFNVQQAVGSTPKGYHRGTQFAHRGWHWVGERGPELVHFRGGEKVFNHHTSMERYHSMGGRYQDQNSQQMNYTFDRSRHLTTNLMGSGSNHDVSVYNTVLIDGKEVRHIARHEIEKKDHNFRRELTRGRRMV